MIPLPQDASWVEWRSQGIGGSDAAAICGVDPYKTARDVWEEKMGLKPAFEGNKFTEVGHALEPYAILEFERATGLQVVQRQLQVEHRDRPWMHATLDGLVTLVDGDLIDEAVYEGKVKTGRDLRDWDAEPPKHVILQCQHNMIVADCEWAYVSMLSINKWPWAMRTYTVRRNEEMCQMILELETAFWTKVQRGVWE